MTTTDVSNEAIALSVRNEPDLEATTVEKPLNKVTMAAYNRAKKASQTRDAECAKQVAKHQRKREAVVSGREQPRGRQRTLFDF